MIIESLPDIEFSRCIVKIYVRSLSYQVERRLRIPEEYNDTFQIGDVDGEVNNIDGALFILYVKNGYLTMLEGYTNIIDSWPETDYVIKLKYDMIPRNYLQLRKK